MELLKKGVLIFLILIHTGLLFYFGISTFVTTILFYYLIYKVAIKFSDQLPDRKKFAVKQYSKIIFYTLLAIEFILMFVFKPFNIGHENSWFVYFSPYKIEKQYQLLKFLRPDKTIMPFTVPRLPNLKIKVSSHEFEYIHTFSKDGFRDNKCISQMDTSHYNIVLLGDSFVEGEGTPDDSTLSVLIQDKLKNKASCPDKIIEVYNCGLSGSNPIYEISLYKNAVEKYRPDLVVLCVFNNDLSDMLATLYHGRLLPAEECFFAISHVYRILSLPFGNKIIFQSHTKKNNRITGYINKYLLKEINDFEQYLSNKNTSLEIVYIPDSQEFHNHNINVAMRHELVAKFPNVINLYDQFKQLNDNGNSYINYYWTFNGHFNPKGYDLAAETISNGLIKDKFIK